MRQWYIDSTLVPCMNYLEILARLNNFSLKLDLKISTELTDLTSGGKLFHIFKPEGTKDLRKSSALLLKHLYFSTAKIFC